MATAVVTYSWARSSFTRVCHYTSLQQPNKLEHSGHKKKPGVPQGGAGLLLLFPRVPCLGRGRGEGRLATSYFRTTLRRTIIGAAAFHFRVRNGNGWGHCAMITRGAWGRRGCLVLKAGPPPGAGS